MSIFFFVAFHNHLQPYLQKKKHYLKWCDVEMVVQSVQKCLELNAAFWKPPEEYLYNKFHLGLFEKITTKLFPQNTPVETYFSFGKDRPAFLMVGSCDLTFFYIYTPLNFP
jgi:hypothetical protein